MSLINPLLAIFQPSKQPDPIKPYSTKEERKNEEKRRNIQRLRDFQHRFRDATGRWPAVYPCNVKLPKPEPQA